MKKWMVSSVVATAVLAGLGDVSEQAEAQGEAKNVIFMIPDGYSSGYASVYRAFKEEGIPAWDEHQVGHMMTHSANNRVTDSAAAGTAMATGVKTNNGVIGLNPEGERVQTVLEAAKDSGRSTGLVATSTITHATPAAFASHVSNRNNEMEIANQFYNQDIDVLLGGGESYFLPKSEGGHQYLMNYMKRFERDGYEIARNAEQLQSANSDRVVGLFANNAMAPERDRHETDEPSLQEMTEAALSALDQNDDGFFLMVEGSQIDWAGHANDYDWAMTDTEAFEAAYIEAIEFAKEDEETLVVMASDHDTGGLALDGNDNPVWSTTNHTGVDVPVYSFGPGSEQFGGLMDNTDLPKMIANALDIEL
ncbi:alkaline phosphatase [Geomicrobium sediminis]|uniref:Alkaline phosphatase n=1 Tax=Geomicrobium sediminis TaxID=1347788 RepID=A0ABS2PHR2_9BACL|nr:alkaline phosphatase [Geomicrobium sediminis]MBM7634871.1 alkaline phosphatase [Geomicrobium sediminis]